LISSSGGKDRTTGSAKYVGGKLDPEGNRSSNDNVLMSSEDAESNTEVTGKAVQAAAPDANAAITNAIGPENERPCPDETLLAVAAT
jgi:hypothetical protein